MEYRVKMWWRKMVACEKSLTCAIIESQNIDGCESEHTYEGLRRINGLVYRVWYRSRAEGRELWCNVVMGGARWEKQRGGSRACNYVDTNDLRLAAERPALKSLQRCSPAAIRPLYTASSLSSRREQHVSITDDAFARILQSLAQPPISRSISLAYFQQTLNSHADTEYGAYCARRVRDAQEKERTRQIWELARFRTVAKPV